MIKLKQDVDNWGERFGLSKKRAIELNKKSHAIFANIIEESFKDFQKAGFKPPEDKDPGQLSECGMEIIELAETQEEQYYLLFCLGSLHERTEDIARSVAASLLFKLLIP